MDNIKDKIFDLVYGEITDPAEAGRIKDELKKDPELMKYFSELEKQRELLREEALSDAPDDLLAENREKLSASISDLRPHSVFDVNIYVKNFAKYAAVVLLTFYATMYHFGPGRSSAPSNISHVRTGDIPYKNVSHTEENIYSGIDMNKYKVDNLNIEESGNELIINFDVSTNKVIRGSKNDPEIIRMLNYLVEHENSSGVKYKTMKAMNKSGDTPFTETLIRVMSTDKDPLIRRMAMKMVSDQTSDIAVREALYKAVLTDTDQTNRIEALTILESADSEFANKALRSVSAENNEFFKFKAEKLNLNEK
ncbi:MAG: HEAT repeat domain-containing protein [Candidatus Delongbacteria bacterium]|nr:HEAT repeat domain-containing protein [Candidatus Delongbacteria bacterium]